MNFEYYYGTQSEQFTFIRIPKLILTNETFAGLSLQAKVLYGVLLDRMGLSMKNGWLDEKQRVYIIYQISEIQEDLGFSKKKSMEYLKELEQIGLVEKKRRGLGLPSILYVKSFLSGELAVNENAVEAEKTAESGTSRSVDSGTSEAYSDKAEDVPVESEIDAEPENPEKNLPITQSGTENGTAFAVQSKKKRKRKDTSGEKTSRGVDLGTSRSVDSGTSRGAEIALQEVPKRAPLINNTKTSNTYESDIKSNHISSAQTGEGTNSDEMGCDERSTCSLREKICERIDYDALTQQYPYDAELLDGIADIMLEVEVNQSKTMLIASATYPTKLVQDRFRKLSLEHIQYVMDCFNATTTKVGNIKKYLMTALFNAPSTISGYYTAEVHHDMPYLVR